MIFTKLQDNCVHQEHMHPENGQEPANPSLHVTAGIAAVTKREAGGLKRKSILLP